MPRRNAWGSPSFRSGFGANGTVVGSDPLERRGSFAPNVLIEGLHGDMDPTASYAALKAQNCVEPAAGGVDRVFQVRTARGELAAVTGISVSVEAVDYDDGTSWRATPAAGPR